MHAIILFFVFQFWATTYRVYPIVQNTPADEATIMTIKVGVLKKKNINRLEYLDPQPELIMGDIHDHDAVRRALNDAVIGVVRRRFTSARELEGYILERNGTHRRLKARRASQVSTA